MASSSMPWIKLYTDILDDPKLGRLSIGAKWYFVALCTLAGECDAEGYLVNGDEALTINDIAWRLRENQDSLTAGMEELNKAGLLCMDDDDAWFVTNFAKRQGRPQHEKRALWRERKRKQADAQEEIDAADQEPEETTDEMPEKFTRESRGNPDGITPSEKEEEKEESKSKRKRRTEKDNAGNPPANPPGDPDSLEKPTSKRKTPVPEAIKVFRQNANRYPAKSWYGDVAAVVGRDPPDLERWGVIVKEWVGNGWNPTNVRGMLDKFQGKTKDGTTQENGRKVITVS